jgi:hypothetical protein
MLSRLMSILWWISFTISIFAIAIVISEGFMIAFTGEPVLYGDWLIWLSQRIWNFVVLWIVCVIYKIWQLILWTE